MVRSRCSTRAASGYAAPGEPRARSAPLRRGIRRARASRGRSTRSVLDGARRSGRARSPSSEAPARRARGDLRRRRRRPRGSTRCRASSPSRSGPSSRPGSCSGCARSRRSSRTSTARAACSRRAFVRERGGGARLTTSPRCAAPRRDAGSRSRGSIVIRCEDGRFRVIEDQVRMPSGLAYAVAARETLRELLARRASAAGPVARRSASSRWRCATPRRAGGTSRAP